MSVDAVTSHMAKGFDLFSSALVHFRLSSWIAEIYRTQLAKKNSVNMKKTLSC
jgi:hypothetical protein